MRKAPRGIQRINARHDTKSVVLESKSGEKRKYSLPSRVSDRSMIVGELAYEVKRAKWTPGSSRDPHVRTSLNGLNTSDIRATGVCLKTIPYDATRLDSDPSDDPVLAVSGHMTVTNLGQKPIKLGDAVKYELPAENVGNQYKDGVNLLSDDRKVLAYESIHVQDHEMHVQHMDKFKRYVGVAVSGANPGENFELCIQPLPILHGR